MKRPATQYYWGDWRRDTALQSCSLAARGLWHEMNCLMHDCDPYGHLCVGAAPMSPSQLARLVGITPRECTALLAELETAGVFSRSEVGVIFSRRMVRDEQLRERRASGGQAGAEHGTKGAEYGKKGGRPRKQNPPSDDAEGGSKTPLVGSNKPPPASASASAEKKEEREHTRGVCALALAEVRKSFPLADESADLLALVEQGATPGEIGAIAAEAATKGKGWPWVVTTVVGRRQDAAKLALAPKPEPPWHETRSGIVAKGVELGVGEWSEAEWHAGRAPQWPTYQAKVYAAAGYEPPRMSA